MQSSGGAELPAGTPWPMAPRRGLGERGIRMAFLHSYPPPQRQSLTPCLPGLQTKAISDPFLGWLGRALHAGAGALRTVGCRRLLSIPATPSHSWDAAPCLETLSIISVTPEARRPQFLHPARVRGGVTALQLML